ARPGRRLRILPASNRRWLPHPRRGEPGPVPRRFYFFFQEAVRFLADITRPRIGPGPAFVVLGTGGLADLVALAAFQGEAAVIAAGPVDRGFDRAVARLHHAGA